MEQFSSYFISVWFLENTEVCTRSMVKYGPADSRSHCGQHIWETKTLVRPPRLWFGGSAPQASDHRLCRPGPSCSKAG